MEEMDLLSGVPKINDMKFVMNELERTFKLVKEESPGEFEKAALIEAVIQSAQNELKKAKSYAMTIEDLPLSQQARLFADFVCLQAIFFKDMLDEDFDDEELDDEDEFYDDEEDEFEDDEDYEEFEEEEDEE